MVTLILCIYTLFNSAIAFISTRFAFCPRGYSTMGFRRLTTLYLSLPPGNESSVNARFEKIENYLTSTAKINLEAAAAKKIRDEEEAAAKKIRDEEEATAKKIRDEEEAAAKKIRDEEEAAARKIRDEEMNRIEKQLKQLIGYNCNQDMNLENICGRALKMYLIESLGISEDYIMSYDHKKIYNCTNGIIAVEWDTICLIDYSDKPPNETLSIHSPPHNTIFLMEVKQNMNLDEVLGNIPRRVIITRDIINSDVNELNQKKKVKNLVASQLEFFINKDPSFVIAIGSKNLNATSEAKIIESGYLALSPSGEDFKISGSISLV